MQDSQDVLGKLGISHAKESGTSLTKDNVIGPEELGKLVPYPGLGNVFCTSVTVVGWIRQVRNGDFGHFL